jgi:hypothetical protein
MPTKRTHPGEDIRNHLAVLVQNLEWLKDAVSDEDEDDELADVLAEMFAAIAEIEAISKELPA